MISMQRPGLYKRCVALVLVMMFCLLPLASLAATPTGGVIKARALNLRVSPNTDAAIVTSFPSGTWVKVLESNNGWHKVEVGGLTGYMSAQYIRLDNVTTVTDAKVSGASGYINLRETASINAKILAQYPNGTRVKVLAHEGGFYRVQVGELVGYMADHLVRLDDVQVATYAVIRTTNGGNLNLRENPSMDAKVLQSFAPNTKVQILSQGKEWHKVRVQGVTGYMRAEFLQIGGTVNPPAPPKPSGKIGIVNNPRATQVLNLRETASLDARVLAYYYNGKQVEILGTTGDWYKVKVDGMTGYMMKKFVKVSDNTVTTNPFEAKLKNPNGGSIVNFRQQPGLNTKILATYPVGKTVTVIEYGTDWSKVVVDGVTGYVSSYFLKF